MATRSSLDTCGRACYASSILEPPCLVSRHGLVSPNYTPPYQPPTINSRTRHYTAARVLSSFPFPSQAPCIWSSGDILGISPVFLLCGYGYIHMVKRIQLLAAEIIAHISHSAFDNLSIRLPFYSIGLPTIV